MPYGQNPASAAAFLTSHPEVRAIDVLLADASGVLRGKRVDRDGLAQVYSKGLFLPGSMFALDVLGGTIEATGLGFDDGDADRPCLPIANTLLPVPWLDGVAQVQVGMFNPDGSPFYGDPRHALDRVVQRFDALGLTPVVAIELEFYLVDRERAANGSAQPPCSPLTGRREFHTQINSMADLDHYSRFLAAVSAACAAQDVPSGAALAECGPGQFEVNLKHVADARLACDHAIRLKRIVKGVALSQGFDATFMAKPYRDMAGSGTHVHVSLLDRDGHNVFASEDAAGNATLQSAIAGLVATMPEGMAVYAPNANSYRRYRPESYVPMAATWGVNNRGVAVRIPFGGAEDRRLEHRVAGADANPYLLTAIILAGMHHGLADKLTPPPRLDGNAYHHKSMAAQLPRNWASAIERFEQSSFMQDYLGANFVKLYAGTRRGEMEEFESFVSTLEYDWYLAAL